jgi:hypothetical protein
MATGNDILIKIAADNKDILAKLDQVSNKMSETEKKIKESGGGWIETLKGIGAAVAAHLTIETLKDLVKLAGEVDTVGQAFRNLAKDAEGGSEGLLEAIKTATEGTISNLDIMKDANLAIQLMGKDALTMLPKMGEIAFATAKAQGKEVKEIYNDLILGTGRDSIRVLQQLGITNTQAKARIEEYAKSIGRTTNALNENKKRQAYYYTILKEGQSIIDSMGEHTLTLGERLQIMKANSENFKEEVSKNLIPGLEMFLNTITRTDAEGSSFATTLGKIGSTVAMLASMLIYDFMNLGPSFELLWQNIKLGFLGTIAEMAGAFGKFTQVLSVGLIPNKANPFKQMAGSLKEMTAQIEEDMKITKKEVQSVDEVSREMWGKLNQLWEKGIEKNNDATGKRKPLLDEHKEKANISELFAYLGMKMQAETAKNEEARLALQMKFGFAGVKLKEAQAANDVAIQKKFESEYQDYLGNTRDAELLKAEVQRNELMRVYSQNNEKRIEIEKAYDQKRRQIEVEHNTFTKNLLTDSTSAFNKAYSSFESATKKALKEAMFGKGGWSEWRKAMKNILEDFVIDVMWAVAKALILKAVVGSTTGGIGGGGLGAVLGGLFQTGYLPSYAGGKLPVLATGSIPSDHFPAYIGTREAVITAESTRANYPMIKWMYDNPGQQVPSQGNTINQVNNFTGNVLSKDFIDNNVVKRLKELSRYEGKDFTPRQRV